MAEMVLFLSKTGESMLDAIIRPYIVQAVCRDMSSGNTLMCTSTNDVYSVQDDVQSTAARYIMYYRILMTVPAVLLALLCGAWSDRNGRKISMAIPGVGGVLSVVVFLITFKYKEHTLPLILVGAAIQGMFGKASLLPMAVQSYVSDITDDDQRTHKMGRLMSMQYIGMFAGSLLASILEDTTSLEVALCAGSAVHALTVFITLFWIQEVVPGQTSKTESDSDLKCTLFSLSGLMQSLTVLSKERKNNFRSIIVILFISALINQICRIGDADVTVLFVQRSPLFWPESWYGYLLALDYCVMGAVLLLLLPLLSNVLHFSDVTLLMIAIFFKLIRSFWAGFCTKTWMMYTSMAIGGLAGMLTPVIRSFTSKHVQDDEQGKAFSLLSSGETASKLLGSIIFTNIYSATVSLFPGLTYLFEGFLYLVMFLMMVWLYKLTQFKQSDSVMHPLANRSPKVYTEDRE
ncbi:proton-coupled folate transporter-like [Gigantopelta aegis]|uniref:proton-coupled folate transporter-like n=1 Tax=Gigantopelta aegis TaxID=1735272 RepID=UPI001B887CC8|nr:proton-coupled folate transporter-like [Gigantopelta aegis]